MPRPVGLPEPRETGWKGTEAEGLPFFPPKLPHPQSNNADKLKTPTADNNHAFLPSNDLNMSLTSDAFWAFTHLPTH
jgi:hypothetical protein